MASKVNPKIVIIIVAGVVVVGAGLVGLAAFNTLRSGDRLIAMGDEAMQSGDFKLASEKYSRGVNKDQSRIDWLEKWLEAIRNTTPPTRAQYTDAYTRQYLNILNKMAVLRPTEPKYQLPLIEELDRRYQLLPGSVSVVAMQSHIKTINERLERIKDRTDDPIVRQMIGIRGIAELQEMRLFPVDDTKREAALEDLRVGESVTKDDPRCAMAIVDWYEWEINRLERRENRPDEVVARGLREGLAQARADLVAKYGDHPEVIVHEFLSDAQAKELMAKSAEDAQEIRRSLAGPTADLLAKLDAIPVEKFDVDSFLDAAVAVATYDDPSTEADEKALADWAEKFLKAHPDDPRTIIAVARLERAAKNYDRSFELFDQCVALPDIPVSLEGIVLPNFRRLAAGERVDTALLQRERAEDPEQKAKFLEVAKAQRDALEPLVDAGSEWELTLREARLAMVEENYLKAIQLFQDLRAQGQADNPSILIPLADALTRSGSEGMAKSIYERLIANGTNSVPILSRLAEIELGLGNIPGAEDLYLRAQRLEPSNTYVAARLASIHAASSSRGGGNGASGSSAGGSDAAVDPVVSLALQARRARQDGNLAAARDLLRQARDLQPTDARLAREAVMVELDAKDRPAALKIVEEALAADPNSVPLKTLKTQVEIEDPVEAALQIIEDSPDPPVVKALSRYVLYMQHQMVSEADAAFAEAEKADPNSPGVIEVGFNRALRNGKADGFAKATEFAERAARLDTDQRGGLTFQGRLELLKGNRVAAEQTLQRAVEKMEFDPNSWRWLAQAQRANGKIDQALASYEHAYNGDPKDVAIAAEYASLLESVQQGPKALSVLSPETGVLRFADRSSALVSLWLRFEAQYGDRDKAMEARKKLFESDPSDSENTRQYFGLVIAAGDYEEATRVIDAMAKVPDVNPLEVVGGKARILATQDDVEGARKLLTDYVASVPEKDRTFQEYMALGMFEREYGPPETRYQAALAAFEAGAPYQDPKVRELDRAAGDMYFAMGDEAMQQAATLAADGNQSESDAARAAGMAAFAGAEKKYKAVLDANSDATEVQKRYAETLIRLERYDEALAVLERSEANEDLQVLLLRASVAVQRDDLRKAREILDDACQRFASSATPFFRRALLNRADPSRAQDVMKDLDQAVKLDPGMIEAWQLKFALLASENRIDDAIAQLGLAVKANPLNDDLLVYYIRILRGANRLDEAKKFAIDTANARDSDVKWLRRAAILAYDNEDFQQAEALYYRINDIEKTQGSAMDLLNCYLRRENPPPTRAEVNRVLQLVTVREDLTPGGMMLMARAKEFLDERAEAESWTLDAYKLAKTGTPLDVRLWFENVVLRFKKDREKAFDYVLTKKEFQPLPIPIRLLELRREVANGKDLKTALEELNAMEPECDPAANNRITYNRVEFLRLRNMFHYSLSQYAEAVEDCREGLRLLPRDLEFNNNLAYILAKHMNDPAAAEEPAKIAAEVAPVDPAVLDTLGWVYFKNGKYRDADTIFARSIQTSKTPDDFVPTYLHQAQSKMEIGDVDEATRFIRLAKQNLDKASQTIKEQYTDEVMELYTKLVSGS